ncbi:hypothetical protein GW17_00037228 [Ensete ventricosum]|nr:hypothetical protein GW17_00037228 [Ensete ventricosum]
MDVISIGSNASSTGAIAGGVAAGAALLFAAPAIGFAWWRRRKPQEHFFDVPAANILLDEEFEAVVGDFGLAKLMDYKDTHVTTAVKGLLKEKKLEMLIDPDLQNNYVDSEVESLIQVALLCTQGSPMERPKMSEVVRMLEGDGLAERWDEWQKVEVVRHEAEFVPRNRASDWIWDSTVNLRAVELSGPSDYSSTKDQKSTPARGDCPGSRSTNRRLEELAHPSGANEESQSVHVYAGSSKPR